MSNNSLATSAKVNSHMPTLHSLRKHYDAKVRAAVASNPNTASVTLKVLAHDSSAIVLEAVANNQNAPRLHRFIARNKYRKVTDF